MAGFLSNWAAISRAPGSSYLVCLIQLILDPIRPDLHSRLFLILSAVGPTDRTIVVPSRLKILNEAFVNPQKDFPHSRQSTVHPYFFGQFSVGPTPDFEILQNSRFGSPL